nr:monocarboxylate transporter 14-like [Lytechinus pictus]
MLICGACLISLGVILTALAPNNVMIAVLLALAGIGHCLLAISLTIALDQLADKKNFDILYGVGMSGFGFGMELLPYLADIFGKLYGWRSGLLMLGGLIANLVPCVVSMRVNTSTNEDISRDRCKNIDHVDDFLENRPADQRFYDCLTTSDEDITPLCRARSSVSSSYHQSEHSSALNQNRDQLHQQNNSLKQLLENVRDNIRHSSFYKDPLVNLMFTVSILDGFVYCGWHAFLVPRAIQRGYSIDETIVMTLFASLGNFCARLLSGALSGRLSNPIFLYIGVTLVIASALLCDVFIHQYYAMFVTACVSAIGIAGASVLGPLVVRKRVCAENFDVAYAIYELCFGSGTFIGGYLSGIVGGHFASYDASFTLLAGVELVVCLLMLPILLLKQPNH